MKLETQITLVYGSAFSLLMGLWFIAGHGLAKVGLSIAPIIVMAIIIMGVLLFQLRDTIKEMMK